MDSNPVTRRVLIGGVGGVGVTFALVGGWEAFARPDPRTPGEGSGYGPLVPSTDPGAILSLPAGFSYAVVARSGVTATDDIDPISAKPYAYPSDPDGMGVFAGPDEGSVLVTNHENGTTEPHRVPVIDELTYDPGAIGGTSTVSVDQDGRLLGSYTSLAGTDNNCAGGITPWGSWLTCEETERTAKTKVGGRQLRKDHGFVFEVDPAGRESNLAKSPQPLSFLGRYSHEAVAVDPDTSEIYLTEDAVGPNGLYYRWTPPPGFVPGLGALHALADADGANAGRLQAMSCWSGRRHIVDLSEATAIGTRYRVHWVDVPDRLAATKSTRIQAYAEPVTRSRKLEGQWWTSRGPFFVASFARPEATGDGSLNAHDGQVWHLDVESQTITLRTLFGLNPQPEQEGTWDGPDNITMSPHGGLIVAEDGEGKNHLIGIGRRGDPYPLARNDQAENGEFCGPAFSSDGRILFANIQSPTFGATVAITGPWRRQR